MNRSDCHRLAERVLSARTLPRAIEYLRPWSDVATGAWKRDIDKLIRGLERDRPPFRVFIEGNSKLPFYAFSTLPIYTCPGKGECAKWCYSLKAWRYPAAFYRQLQNTLLLMHRPAHVAEQFFVLPDDIPLRLYVDGDISSIGVLAFWFRLLTARPDIQAYGYSKSWRIFDDWRSQGLPWPTNYRLNLSNGGIDDNDAELKARMLSLPITRGEFVVVPTAHTKAFDRIGNPAYYSALRADARVQTGANRVFACPGKCGACLPGGAHACGSPNFQDVVIAIGAHR